MTQGIRQSFSPEALLSALNALPRPRRYIVAFSGGADSVALLHALSGLGPDLALPVAAIHVDHGINASSRAWAEFCKTFADARSIPLSIVRVSIDTSMGVGIEAAARAARYSAFRELLDEGDLLLTAHHADDQVETFFLNLMRGSGPTGLSAMPAYRVFGSCHLARPLLNFSRASLKQYAVGAHLEWIEDPSNADTAYNRNFLRHRVLPLLRERWPGCDASVLASVALQQTAHAKLAKEVSQHLDHAMTLAGWLRIEALEGLSPFDAGALVKAWVQRCCGVSIGQRTVSEVLSLVRAGADRQPRCSVGDWEVVRAFSTIRLLRAKELTPRALTDAIKWEFNAPLIVPAIGLYLEPATLLGMFPGLTSADAVEVRFRIGGEALFRGPRASRAPLKDVMQAAKVPVWRRPIAPLVFINGVLVGVLFEPVWSRSHQ